MAARAVVTRPLRKDARDNREKILAAAVSAMLREGQNVPLASIATEAKVGVGTLYRRYPNRAALLGDLELRGYEIIIDTLDGILNRDETALRSIELFLDATIAHRSQLILPLHGGPVGTSDRARELREDLYARVRTLLDRGRVDATIRSDVRVSDVIIFGAILAQPLANIGDWDRLASRQKRHFLHGIASR